MPASDSASDREWRRARRQAARRLHPDRGGEVAGYLAAVAEVDRRFGMVRHPPLDQGSDTVVGLQVGWRPRVRRAARRRRRAARRTLRAVRARLPRWVPGSVRYARL